MPRGQRDRVAGMITSTLRLSRRVWTRLHARDHCCLVIWVAESHICMQSITALSYSFCRDCERPGGCLCDPLSIGAALGNSRSGKRSVFSNRIDGDSVCARAAPPSRPKVMIATRRKRIGHSRKPAMRWNERSGFAGEAGPLEVSITSRGPPSDRPLPTSPVQSKGRSPYFAALHVVVDNLLCTATRKVDCKLCVVNSGHGSFAKLRM